MQVKQKRLPNGTETQSTNWNNLHPFLWFSVIFCAKIFLDGVLKNLDLLRKRTAKREVF